MVNAVSDMANAFPDVANGAVRDRNSRLCGCATIRSCVRSSVEKTTVTVGRMCFEMPVRKVMNMIGSSHACAHRMCIRACTRGFG